VVYLSHSIFRNVVSQVDESMSCLARIINDVFGFTLNEQFQMHLVIFNHSSKMGHMLSHKKEFMYLFNTL